jgi:hypothetical protein
MFGLAVCCLAFGAATRTPEQESAAPSAVHKAVGKPAITGVSGHFFVDPPHLPAAARTRVPIEALLLQIENHVRLEQAAAECFLASPTASLLHSRTTSSLVN